MSEISEETSVKVSVKIMIAIATAIVAIILGIIQLQSYAYDFKQGIRQGSDDNAATIAKLAVMVNNLEARLEAISGLAPSVAQNTSALEAVEDFRDQLHEHKQGLAAMKSDHQHNMDLFQTTIEYEVREKTANLQRTIHALSASVTSMDRTLTGLYDTLDKMKTQAKKPRRFIDVWADPAQTDEGTPSVGDDVIFPRNPIRR